MNDSCQQVILELTLTFKELLTSSISSSTSKRVIDIPQLLKELDIEYNRFYINITKLVCQNVEDAFAKLLSFYDIKEKKDKSNKSLVERCKMISIDSQKAQDTFLETGKFVSVVSKSLLLPLIRDNITHVYQLLFNEKLRIRVDVVLMKDGHVFSCTDLLQPLVGDYQVVLDNNVQLLRFNFLKSLNRWTCPLESILPYKVFQAQPEDFCYLESLYSDMISESFSLIDSCNEKINDYVLEILEICYKSANQDFSVSDFCDFCQHQMEQLKKIESTFTRKLVNTRKGIFDVNISNVSHSIAFAIKSAKVQQEMRAKEYLNNRVLDIHKSYDHFFTIVEPVKFEQTQKASLMVKELERTIPLLIDQINGNISIKAFLDSKLWLLNDDDVEKYYTSCTRLEELFRFRDFKKGQVKDALDKLELGIGREIQMFMTLWRNVEGAMSKLFTSNKTPIIVVGKETHGEPISNDQICNSLTWIIKHISKTAEIANIISKKIDLLESVPGTEEMKSIWKLMKDRTLLVQVLLNSRTKLDEWMDKPLHSLQVDEIESECNKFIQVLHESDLAECWLVSSSRERLTFFLNRDLSIIKSLKSPILQVNIITYFRNGIGMQSVHVLM